MFVSFFLLKGIQTAYSQDIRVMFYNLENLFDTYDDTLTRDEEFLPDGDRRWNNYKFYGKINRLSKAIIACSKNNFPAIIGVCEVENKFVLEQLITQTPLKQITLGIIHQDSKDRRGIDVALLYRKDLFTPIDFNYIPVVFPWDLNYKTRDVLHVKGLLLTDTIHFFVNHWPSKYGGAMETVESRAQAARTVKTVTDTLIYRQPKSKIIIMGDLNDTPDDISVKEVLMAPINQKQEFVNLMANRPVGEGSNKYQANWSFIDQFIITQEVLTPNKGFKYVAGSADACKESFLLETDDKYFGFKPKRTFVGFSYQEGFADHLPITLDLTKIEE